MRAYAQACREISIAPSFIPPPYRGIVCLIQYTHTLSLSLSLSLSLTHLLNPGRSEFS